jgi:hypothetical protein
MLITFAVLAAAAAVSPAVWFTWWVLADMAESRRSRHARPVVAMPRAARAPVAAAGPRQRAA